VINTNLPLILHRFRDTAFDGVQNRYIRLPLLRLTSPPSMTEGFRWDDLCKILPECQWMPIVLNGVEILPKIYVWRRSMTEDRQTDVFTTTYGEREFEFTFAKTEQRI